MCVFLLFAHFSISFNFFYGFKKSSSFNLLKQ